MTFKIGDKVVVMSINENETEEHFRYYSTIDGVQIKESGDRYTIGGRAINPDITVLATEDEIKQFFN